MWAILLAVLLLYYVPRHTIATAGDPLLRDGWIQARATFFGAPEYFSDAYAVRGEGSFGDILYGSCGYFEQQGTLPVRPTDVPYNQDAVAAVGVLNADFPGSCGRCYEVRCRPGVVLGFDDLPVSTDEFFVLEDVNATVLDTRGRRYPGNAGKSKKQQVVQCWNASSSIVVTIIDSCPAVQIKEGNESVPQRWCLGDQWHMDLSFWAFERLAHPVYGVMGIEARPVNCYTKEPLRFLPGVYNKTLYGERPEAGWRWNPFYAQYVYFFAPKAGIDGSNATCLSVTQGGGINLGMPNGTDVDYQPFANARTLSLWITPNAPPPPPGVPAQPPIIGLPIKLGLYNAATNRFCDGSIELPTTSPVARKPNGYLQYSVTLDEFRCARIGGLGAVDTLLVQSIAPLNETVRFCLDQVMLGS